MGLAALTAALLFGQPDPAALIPLYKRALAEREKAFGPEHPKVARAASDLGLLLRNSAKPAEAEPYLRRALKIDEQVLGADSSVAGEDLENLASVLPNSEALPLYQVASRHKDTRIAARNLSKLASMAPDRVSALRLYREALAKEETAARLNDVALLVEPKEAEPLLRRALAMQEKAVGPRHPETAATLNNLADALLASGRVAHAETLSRRAVEIFEKTLGPGNPRVATSMSNLADILRAKKDYAGARRYYERALAIDEKAYGPKHAEVAVDIENLAGLLDEMGRREEARKLRGRAAR
ncbi:MAG: tetratricopeptide repeat protein [Bryobacteraceae bacterium]